MKMNDPPPSYDNIAVEEGTQQGRSEVPENDDNGAQTNHEISPIPENQPRAWKDHKLQIRLAIFAFIIMIAAILGSVLGTQLNRPSDNNDETETKSASSTSSTAASSTPTSSTEEVQLLEREGLVGRDIGISAGFSNGFTAWDLPSEGKLWRYESGGPWMQYDTDERFLVAPVALRTGPNRQMAFSVDAIRGKFKYMEYFGGWNHENWTTLEIDDVVFLTRPSVVSRAVGRADVFGRDSEGRVWLVSYDGEAWSEWKELGSGFEGELASTSWGEDRIDVFGKSGIRVMHLFWTEVGGWAQEWTDVGEKSRILNQWGAASSPRATTWIGQDGNKKIDLIVSQTICPANRSEPSVCAGDLDFQEGEYFDRTIRFENTAWESDWHPQWLSSELLTYPESKAVAPGIGSKGEPIAYVFIRDMWSCVRQLRHDDSGWGSMGAIWCENAPGEDEIDIGRIGVTQRRQWPLEASAAGAGIVQMVLKDDDHVLWRYENHGLDANNRYVDEWYSLGNWEDNFER